MEINTQIRKSNIKILQTIGVKALFIIVLFFCSFCTNKSESSSVNKVSHVIKTDTLIAPETVLIKNPIIVNLDTCPKPQVIKLGSPETKPANFFVQMKNYSTDEGLTLSAIYCCYRDQEGNLWFGTAGGGVSRYDGKSFTNYGIAQGLPHVIVQCITGDKNGNIWFGTDGGASRYDGKSFTNYTDKQGLASNEINDIIEDENGNVWFASSNGVSRYDPSSDSYRTELRSGTLAKKSGRKLFTNYTTDQGLASNIVKCIVEDKNENLWIGTSEGVSRLDKNRKKIMNYSTAQGLANNDVNHIMEDKNGNIWFGTSGGGISKLDKEIKPLPIGKVSFKNYNTAQGLANNVVFSIMEDENGNIWFGTRGGVSCYTPSSDSYRTEFSTGSLDEKAGKNLFVNYSTNQGLANNDIRDITEDKNGNIWFSSYGAGVSCFNKNGSFTNYTSKEGLPNTIVWSIMEDKNGNFWFGTEGGGMSRLDKNRKNFTSYNTKQGLPNNSVRLVFEDRKKNIWFSIYDVGVSKLDKNEKFFTNFTTKQGLTSNKIVSIYEDKNGNIWFGTNGGGVYRLDKNGKTLTNYNTTHGLLNNIVWRIIEDKNGNIWLGTFGGGVSRLDKDGKSFTNFTSAQGLPNNDILSILEDKKGNIWFGTTEGISRYAPSPDSYRDSPSTGSSTKFSTSSVDERSRSPFKNYTTTDGLPDDVITQIIEDKNGKIWIGTNKGICGLNFKTLPNSTKENKNRIELIPGVNSLTNAALQNYTPVFDIYNHQTGYPVKDVNGGNFSMFIDPKGLIWAGTGDEKTGLVHFNPSALNKNKNPPEVVIQSIKINEENIAWNDLTASSATSTGSVTVPANITEEVTTFGKALTEEERNTMQKKFADVSFDSIERFYPIPKNLRLPYNHNNVTINFAAIELANPLMVRYQYILEGYDKEWSPVTEKTSATFGNIYEGTYTFKLKAQSPDGVWSNPITYSFKVLPPWYRTWWAYGIGGVSSLLLLFGTHRWRTASLHRDKEILEQTVQERTAEVMKQKNEAEKQRNEAEKQKKLVEEINNELEKLSIVARETANGVFITDANGDLEWFNEGFSKLFGWESIVEYKEKRGKNIFDVSGNQNIDNIIKEAIEQKKSIIYENATPAKNSEELWTQTTLTPIFNQDGQLNKLVFVETDITELKRAEERLISANKEMEAFSYSVSHDLRAPLRAINGYSKILEDDYASKLDAEGVSSLHAILKNSKRMGQLIDDLLEFSRLGRTEEYISKINMTVLVQSIIKEEEMNGNPNKIEFSVSELINVNGIQKLIKQVWINLISNAIKYSKNNPKPHIEIGSYLKDQSVVYYVRDNGAGFNMQYYDKLFGVFQRLHSHHEFEGTGIGLAIVQKIIQRHNGAVWAESKPNEGACFYFSLPTINP